MATVVARGSNRSRGCHDIPGSSPAGTPSPRRTLPSVLPDRDLRHTGLRVAGRIHCRRAEYVAIVSFLRATRLLFSHPCLGPHQNRTLRDTERGLCFGILALSKTLVALSETNETLARLDKSKSLLLRETAHGVANNFATVAALLSMKSISVDDIKAKRSLDEAVEQVKVMAHVHRRLRARDQDVSLDSAAYIRELCDDLEEMAHGRPIVIECEADSLPLCMQQAVLLALILNELVTNAIKHAFPGGRAGRIRVRFETVDFELRLTVEGDGFGRCLGTAPSWVKGRHWCMGSPTSLRGTWNSSRQRAEARSASCFLRSSRVDCRSCEGAVETSPTTKQGGTISCWVVWMRRASSGGGRNVAEAGD